MAGNSIRMLPWLLSVMITTIAVVDGKDVILCNGLVFQGIYYDKELLFKGIGRPYNLMLHKYSGVLFFSHTIQNGSLVDFGIKACNINSLECKDITSVPGGYAIAYDRGNDDIYFGGHDGIYKYNFITKQADFFAEQGTSIWGLFVRRNFYYIEYPTQKLYMYVNDAFEIVEESADIEIDNFFESKANFIYYSNKTALFRFDRSNNDDSVMLNDVIVVRQIIDDFYGDVFFCASDGIYIEDRSSNKLEKVADIDQAYGMTFDNKDQLIYSNKHAIYRLLPSKYNQLCLDALAANEYKKKKELRFENLIS